MKLGTLISLSRGHEGLSLSQAAKVVGISKAHLWCIEQGRTVNIGIVVAARLCETLNIRIQDMAAAALEDSDNG